jgi:hypothetical protein
METTIYMRLTEQTGNNRNRICTIKETLSTAIAEWLETGEVNVSNYPIKYVNAILSQERIGWRHFFAGNKSQKMAETTG